MKALTVWQPWASLIVAGAKPYEFRGWRPYRSMIGQRIVIHASSRPMRAGEVRDIVDNLKFGGDNAAVTCLHVDKALDLLMPLYHFKRPTGLPLGCGLGTAVLGEAKNGFDVALEMGASEEAIHELGANDSDRDEHANWGWPMLEIEPFVEPIPMRGAQGFWPWPEPEDVLP